MALPSGRVDIEGEGAGKYSRAVNVPDGDDIAKGATTDAEAVGDGSQIAILKRLRTILGTSGSLEAPCPVAHCVTDTPAADTAAVATAGAVAATSHVLYGVEWSYSDVPAAASTLVITDGGVAFKTIYITHEGPGFLPFKPGIQMVANQDLVATLLAGGAGVIGTVNMSIKQV